MSGRRIFPIAIVAIAVVAIAVVVLLSLDDDGDDTTAVPSAAAKLTTPAALASLAGQIGHPIYWVGERAGAELELTKEADGNIYVRYLTGGAEAGDPGSEFLTVGTYPVGDAESAVKRAARQAGAPVHDVPGGGIAFLSPEGRRSAYVAFPGSAEQIEVYDPVGGRSLELAEAGRVVPVG